MDQYMTYDVEYKVLICRQHKYAIPPDTILRHFRQSHKGIPLPTRQAISDYSKTVDLASPEDVAMPLVPVRAIKHLRMFNGFQCQYDGCSELRSTDVSMKQHCWAEHGWVAATGIMWKDQGFQTIFDGTRRK
jgi:hypothetical protein